ncbi:Uncharacterised protein [Enterobacter cloacae]|nr:Uncharacterised protein [Enterobacter cloacae]
MTIFAKSRAGQKVSNSLRTGITLILQVVELPLVNFCVTGLFADRLGEYKHSVLLT